MTLLSDSFLCLVRIAQARFLSDTALCPMMTSKSVCCTTVTGSRPGSFRSTTPGPLLFYIGRMSTSKQSFSYTAAYGPHLLHLGHTGAGSNPPITQHHKFYCPHLLHIGHTGTSKQPSSHTASYDPHVLHIGHTGTRSNPPVTQQHMAVIFFTSDIMRVLAYGPHLLHIGHNAGTSKHPSSHTAPYGSHILHIGYTGTGKQPSSYTAPQILWSSSSLHRTYRF